MSEIIVMFPPRAGVNAQRLLDLQQEFEPVRGALRQISHHVGVRTDADSLALRVCARDGFCGQFMELAAALGLYQALCDEGIRPKALAVHCLGVYTALAAAGCTSTEGAFELLHAHVECILSLGGELTTVKGLPVEDVEGFCEERGGVEVSTHNGRRLCTVSGPPEGLCLVEQWALGRGGKLRRLAGFGAWHFSQNREVRDQLIAIAERYVVSDAAVPIWFPLAVPRQVSRRDDVVATIVEQALAPVCWYPFMRNYLRREHLCCVEVGPARSIAQFEGLTPEEPLRIRGFQTRDELSQVVREVTSRILPSKTKRERR